MLLSIPLLFVLFFPYSNASSLLLTYIFYLTKSLFCQVYICLILKKAVENQDFPDFPLLFLHLNDCSIFLICQPFCSILHMYDPTVFKTFLLKNMLHGKIIFMGICTQMSLFLSTPF